MHVIVRYIYCIKEKILNIGEKWDEMAVDREYAIEFAHRYINQEPDSKEDENLYILAHNGCSINDRYRKNNLFDYDSDVSETVSKNKTDMDLVLYRGVHKCVYKLMEENAKKLKGCQLYEKGFLATSLVKGRELGSEIRLRIYVPAGTKCVYMGNVNEEQNFYEVDVMHGAKLKIVSMDREYINCQLLGTE